MQTYPRATGLYDPRFEHDSCGVSFVVDLHGRRAPPLGRPQQVRLLVLPIGSHAHRRIEIGAQRGRRPGAVIPC